MDFTHFLDGGAVVADLPVANKKTLFQSLANLAEREMGLAAKEVVERLNERERLGTTGFGGGVAIPHGRLPGLSSIRAAMVRLDRPIDYAAIDDLPVDIVFMMLSPADAGAEHLKALAQVSRRLRDRAFVANCAGRDRPTPCTRCSPAPKPAMPPDSGAQAHFRALEALYAAAPINSFFESHLEIPEEGVARITFDVDERVYHAAGAAHARPISRCSTTPPSMRPTAWSPIASCSRPRSTCCSPSRSRPGRWWPKGGG